MFYQLFSLFSDQYSFLNIFRYVTFRCAGAALTALILFVAFAPKFIQWLKEHQGEGQPIRLDGPESHLLTKKGTPTMGGVLVLLVLSVTTLLWARFDNPYIWIVMTVTLGYGLVGAVDDYSKLTKRCSRGVSARNKSLAQFFIAGTAVIAMYKFVPGNDYQLLSVPFFKNFVIDLGWVYVPFAMCVIAGSSNAVNLTDGLDGLAITPIIMCAGCYGIIAYLVGNTVFAHHLQIHYVPGTQELSVLCSALVGAGLGFLWFNAPPASVFMGDTGSLALGGAIGTIALITKHEIVLMIIGGVFVVETVSVILQVASFKIRGKRIFLMAPIHHHFEKKGWSEPQIVVRFWIISAVLALLGLTTLKLR